MVARFGIVLFIGRPIIESTPEIVKQGVLPLPPIGVCAIKKHYVPHGHIDVVRERSMG